MNRDRASVTLALSLAILATGCAWQDWRHARAEDTAAGYHRFLREHPGSGRADEAQARLAFVQVRTRPSIAGFEEFSRKFASSGLVDELKPYIEPVFFERARATGSADAYADFLIEFGGGAFAARARGNEEYLRNRGFDGDPIALASFAEHYGESDFAAEARRSLRALNERSQATLRAVALIIDVDPATPGADRLRRVFSERAVSAFGPAGIELIPVPSRSDPRASRAGAWLRVAHREGAAQARMDQGTMTQSSLLAETEVTLQAQSAELPIWKATFSYRAPLAARSKDESILFGAGAENYWQSFFVPVATWQNSFAAREPSPLPDRPTSVSAFEGRALVSYADGGFQLWDVADPTRPQVLSEYRRQRDLSRFGGAAVVGSRVAVYGADGLELVYLGPDGPRRERVWHRQEVGSPTAVVDTGRGYALAGNRGLLLVAADEPTPRTLVATPILGLARAGEYLLFSDGSTLFSATLAQLSAGRVASELRLGKGFGPGRIRVDGTRAIVLGERALLCLDVSNPGRPVLRSRLEMSEVGAVRDAIFAGGRIFLLGDRGLQVVDSQGEHVAEAVDVGPRQRLDAGGRHLVLVGERSLQVVDVTPLVASVPAAPASRR